MASLLLLCLAFVAECLITLTFRTSVSSALKGKIKDILVYGYVGIFVYWVIGILVYGYMGILVYLYIGILVYWYIGYGICGIYYTCSTCRPKGCHKSYGLLRRANKRVLAQRTRHLRHVQHARHQEGLRICMWYW